MIVFFMALNACVADWSNWRGPNYNGSSNARQLPARFSLEGDENIAWVHETSGSGNSTPIIVGGRLFISEETLDDHGLWALCLDSGTGKLLWRRRVGTGRAASRNNMAAPSPVSDGKRVYFLYGNGVLAAYDLHGNQVWKRELERQFNRFTQKFGYSSSPLLHDGRIFISVMRWLPPGSSEADQEEKYRSWLLAIDPATGNGLWASERPSPAISESLDSYNTPLPSEEGIILVGGDLVTCSDPRNGRELWRYDYRAPEPRQRMWRIISSPVIAGDLLVCALPRGGSIFALKMTRKGGVPTEAWREKGYMPDVCTPAYSAGLLYVLDGRRKSLTCMNPEDGEIFWREKMASRSGFYASPTVADGRIYCIDRGGDVFVWSTGRQTSLLEHFSLDEMGCNATIVADGNSLYIRTPSGVICARKDGM